MRNSKPRNELPCCGNCKHNFFSKEEQEYVCTNPESEAYGCDITYSDTCEDYEEGE